MLAIATSIYVENAEGNFSRIKVKMLLLLFGWEVSVLFPFTRSNTAMKQKIVRCTCCWLPVRYRTRNAWKVEKH